jgi:hypothetical protein
MPLAGSWEPGGDDFWVRAEMFVNRERAGEIDSTSHLQTPELAFVSLVIIETSHLLDELAIIH